MSSILLKGYNTQGCKIQNKEGQELDEQYLQRYMYRCVQCKFILRWPYQMICGDRICRGCFPSVPFQCPSCEDWIELSEPQQFFTDKSCQNDIKGFIVVCKCGEWQGSLDEWELHVKDCPNVEEVCNQGCGAKFPRALREKHASECPKRPIICPHCGLSVQMDALQLHNLECQNVQVMCDLGCGVMFPRSHQEQHACKCPKRPTRCSLCTLTIPMDTLQMHQQSCCEVSASNGSEMCMYNLHGEVKPFQVLCDPNTRQSAESEMQADMVLPEVVQHMKPDSGAEIAELKKAIAKESHKIESLEKDMKQIRIVVEQLQMDPQVAAGNEESLPGAMASGNVEAKVCCPEMVKDRPPGAAASELHSDSCPEMVKDRPPGTTASEVHCDSCPEMVKDRPPGAAASEVSPETVRRIDLELRKTVSEVADMKKALTKSSRKVESLERGIKQIEKLMEDIRGEQLASWSVADSGEEFPPSATKPLACGDVDLRPQVKRLSEKCGQLNEIVTTLVADVEQHKGTLAQMNISVDHLSQVVPRYESVLEEMNLKIEILEVKSSNGIYVWKVEELGRRYREARTGKTTSLNSHPFYTSNHGYKLCLRAYLYGDGSGKGTHISLFIVLMKSEYDDILSWPFRHRVTLSLINQDNPLSAEAAIMRKFVPNPESSSFQKPKDTFNIASGFPEFAELSVMNDSSFVKNDTIYFRVKLDPPETPNGPDNLNL